MNSTVAICISTYKRPQGLERLLNSLLNLRFEKNDAAVKIVVIDNDEEASAKATVQKIKEKAPETAIVYDVEPQRGIPFARNRSVALAGDVDYIAFIDDDEEADSLWLDELIDASIKYNADVVAGPVLPVFESETPDWIIKGKFFERPRYQTGQTIKFAATNNTLVRKELIDKFAMKFNIALGLTGADDTYFFMQLRDLGAAMVWADSAIVSEYIPGTRTTEKWIVQRAYRGGNSWAICNRYIKRSYVSLSFLFLKACMRLAFGPFLFMAGLVGARNRRIAALTFLARGVGVISGLFGFRYEEYRLTHGS